MRYVEEKTGSAERRKELHRGDARLLTEFRVMAKALSSPILQLIRGVALDQRLQQLPDHDLVLRFNGQRDEAAFHALLFRHGPMVLEVCRGVLGNEADAEDSFQATFLILACKGASIRKTASVGSWLHGVAYRTALKARAQSATRQNHEARAPEPQACEADDLSWREVRQVLHEELTELAERYRAPLVACYLEGKPQDEAAAQLGLATSTLKVRLERGRSLLRARLVRRGLGLMAVLAGAAWPPATTSACVPVTLVSNTIEAALLVAAGPAATVGLISDNVAALTEGVRKAMLLTKLKVLTIAVLLTAITCFAGAIVRATLAEAQETSAEAKQDKPGPANGEKAASKKGMEALRGKWSSVSIEAVSGNSPESLKTEKVDPKGLWMTLEGETMARPATGADGKAEVETFKITLDPDKNPPRLTVHCKTHKLRFIYEVKGDTLRLCCFCLGEQDGREVVAWPTKFSTDDDREMFPRLEMWRRLTDKK